MLKAGEHSTEVYGGHVARVEGAEGHDYVEIGGLTASVAMIYFIIEYSVYRSALSSVLLFLDRS